MHCCTQRNLETSMLAYKDRKAAKVNMKSAVCAGEQTNTFGLLVSGKMCLNSKAPRIARKNIREEQAVNELLLSATCSSPPLEGTSKYHMLNYN